MNLTGVQRDVTYCIANGVDLKMDIYFPSPLPNIPGPATVYVHGGSWRAGDKTRGEGTMEVPELTRRGYVVAAVNYRLAPTYKFPAQIEDVKCAVRYLRANADMLNIDSNRIGAWGGSAGGHLVALLGLTNPSAGLEGNGGFNNVSSRVQAVVDFYGPADLTRPDFAENHAVVYSAVFGATSREDAVLKRASPVSYVSKDCPPFLLVHGSEDKTVLPNQSEELYYRLTAVGVPANLIIVRNGGHGFNPVGGPISPGHEEIVKTVGDFFDKYLRK
jgi:acetyl esterase/lipase